MAANAAESFCGCSKDSCRPGKTEAQNRVIFFILIKYRRRNGRNTEISGQAPGKRLFRKKTVLPVSGSLNNITFMNLP
jgi:hypothetical protein